MDTLAIKFGSSKTGINQRVCIPVAGDLSTGAYVIARRFHSAEAFIYVDTSHDVVSVLSVEEAVKLWQTPKDSSINLQQISSVIAFNISPMAHKILHDKGILVFRPKGVHPETNLELLLSGNLQEYSDSDSLASKLCSASCSDCSTSCN